jgi:isopentenyl-diphosphate delta-isomerase
MANTAISQRKEDHLALCASGEVEFRDRTTLLEGVQLVHCALPECTIDDIELQTSLVGKRLRAPVIIAGMTGGADTAREVNRTLAALAERLGIGFGLGSMRAMLEDPSLTSTYAVRDVAPSTLVLGNLGIVQARDTSTSAIRALVASTGVDALCLHLNPAMELVQPGGDRDFRGGYDTIARLVAELPVPVVVKETGCGLSPEIGERLVGLGVRAVDVSGAGGTSWVGVEARRATGAGRDLGEELWDWGIPTAASVALLADLPLEIIATGGLRTGLDVTRALALGATAGGLAAPVLRALRAGGAAGAEEFLRGVITSVRTATLLAGARAPGELRGRPKVLTGELRLWLDALRAS